MKDTKQTINLTPPIDGVQYGISEAEKSKEGDIVYNKELNIVWKYELKDVKASEMFPCLDYKVILSTNPKDLRFPFLVMPSKEDEALTFANTINPKQDEYSHGRWYGRIEGFNANPAKYTQEQMEQMYDMGRYAIIYKDINNTFEASLQYLQPTAKAVRVEIDNHLPDTDGDFGKPQIRTSSEYPQGLVKALEVIY